MLAGAKSKIIFPTANKARTLTTSPIEDFKKSIISPNSWTLLIPFTKLSKATLAWRNPSTSFSGILRKSTNNSLAATIPLANPSPNAADTLGLAISLRKSK